MRAPSGMIRALLLSIGQLGDRAVVRVLLKSLLLTLVLFAATGVLMVFGVRWIAGSWFGVGETGSDIAGVAALIVAIGGAWLLFRVVAVAVVGIFADDVVAAVERKHYPQALSQARDVPLSRSVAMGLSSAARAIAVNLLLLPLYLLLLVTGIGTAALFFIANGWLLGRDLGEMVAARHLPPAAMRDWRAKGRARRFGLGLVGTGLLVVPVVNLFAPLIGAAMATHLHHRAQGHAPAPNRQELL